MHILDLLARHHPEHAERLKQECHPRPAISAAVERNIATIMELRRAARAAKTRQDHIADAITQFSGSMAFLYLHAAWFGVWMVLNVGEHPLIGFDVFPFGLLTMIVSLEAIFLSTFVLISQNKMGEASDRRADLDLQINLLSEYEITRILRLVDKMAERMGVEEAFAPDLEELETPTRPERVMEEMDERGRKDT